MARFHKDNTIREKSTIYFTMPSDWAKACLFYVQMYGHYVCDRRYAVLDREPFHSFLVMRTLGGSGTLITPLGETPLRTGDIALVDCSQKHDYYASDFWEFQWFHFYGNVSGQICGQFLEKGSNVTHMPDASLASQYIAQIAEKKGDLLVSMDEEVRVSALIHQILADMLLLSRNSQRNQRSEMIAQAISVIQQRYAERISVDMLSGMLGMSNSSFSHQFKAETGFSPYDYIINHRINQAKYMLWSKRMSIAEVSEQVGFSSAANFIKKFREKTGMTPNQFRYAEHIRV